MEGKKSSIEDNMGMSSIGYKGLNIAGLVILLMLFGAVIGISFHTLFHELRDVKNRLEVLENMAHVLRQDRTYKFHTKIKRDVSTGLQHALVPQTSHACCYSLAHPSFLNGPTLLQNLTVLANETVILDCKVSGNPFPTVTWTYENKLIKIDNDRYRTRNNNQELVLNQARVIDSGIYSCQVKNVFGEKEKYVDLRVYEPSSVSVHPETITVEENPETNVSIVCTVWGNPKPSVTWYYQERNGENRTIPAPVNNNTYPQTSTLVLFYPLGTDSGKYLCAVANDFEQQESSSKLTVLSQPYIVDHYNNSELVEDSGNFVVLRCNTIGAPTPEITWIWKKVNGLTVGVHVDDTNGSLILGHVNAFSSGEYECSASNSYGTTNASVNLIIKVDAYSEAVETTVSLSSRTFALQCRVKGDPTPTVEWRRNNQYLDRNTYLVLGKTLVISPGNGEVSGVYTCTARNRFSSHHSKILVYHDIGVINCNSKFRSYNQEYVIYGGSCSYCSQYSVITGEELFTRNDKICESARVSDMINASGMILWKRTYTRSYTFLKWDAL